METTIREAKSLARGQSRCLSEPGFARRLSDPRVCAFHHQAILLLQQAALVSFISMKNGIERREKMSGSGRDSAAACHPFKATSMHIQCPFRTKGEDWD